MRHSASAKTCSLFSLCVFVPFVVCLALGCSGAPKHPSWKTATGAEQHERLLWESIQKKDWNEVERHLSPTFVGVSARGELFDRAGWLPYWKSGPPEEFALGEQSVQPEGPDMKVSYILQVGGAAHA